MKLEIDTATKKCDECEYFEYGEDREIFEWGKEIITKKRCRNVDICRKAIALKEQEDA